MGAPIDGMIVGTNENDILDRFFKTGEMKAEPVVETLSPAMDIQVSSNFERLLFDLFDRSGTAVSEAMRVFQSERQIDVDPLLRKRAGQIFVSHRVDRSATLAEIDRTHADTGQLIDPHTAVGLAAARAVMETVDPNAAVIALACAHPAKFPEPVHRATGVRPRLPERLADLFERAERFSVLPNDASRVKAFIAGQARVTGAAA